MGEFRVAEPIVIVYLNPAHISELVSDTFLVRMLKKKKKKGEVRN